MTRLRTVLGLIAGLMLVLSSGAHTLAGWPTLHAALAATDAPGDLTTNLGLGWNFGGAAMLALGAIVLHHFIGRLRGTGGSRFAPLVIGTVYLAFGAYAFAVARNPFFIGVFVVPGLLLLLAASGSDAAPGASKLEDRF